MWISKKQMIAHAYSVLYYLRYKRLLNIIKLVASFYLSRIIKKPVIWGSPWSLSVEPSGQCNLQCPECPVGAGVLTRKGGMMTPKLFEKILNESSPQLSYINLYFQGEPLLNPKLDQIIKLASQKNIYTTLSTNGHQLSSAKCKSLVLGGLTKLIISIDGLTQKSYSKYRKGGNLEKVKQGINNLIQERQILKSKTPYLIVQFIVFKHNEHEIPELRKWCSQMGIDKLELKTAQFYNFGHEEVQPPSNNKYSRYLPTQNNKLILKGKAHNHCFKQWGSTVVSWDGRIAPCCYDKDLVFSPGNIKNTSLKEIWINDSLNQYRMQILKNKNAIEICKNCTEGRKWLI